MNPRDRLLQTIRTGKADRVPLDAEGFHFVTREEIDALEDKARAEIAHRVFDETPYSVNVGSGVNRYLVTPPQFWRQATREEKNGEVVTTSEIDTPKGKLAAVTSSNPITNTSWTTKYPVESLEDIGKLRSVPWELPTGLGPPDSSKVPEDFEKRGVVRTSISSPFVCVAGAMPYQYFLELCASELELLKELTAMCMERILEVLEVLLAEPGIEYVWMGGCEWLTPPMGAPKHYEELCQEFDKPVIDRIHERGALCHVHCHGNVRSTLELVIERGGDFLEPVEPPPDGDLTFAEAKALAAGRMTLGGNIEARLLEGESVEAVEQATRAAFEGGKEHMVLRNTAGPVSRMTASTLANYHRMLDVWEALS